MYIKVLWSPPFREGGWCLDIPNTSCCLFELSLCSLVMAIANENPQANIPNPQLIGLLC
jgi:hypothetical protein